MRPLLLLVCLLLCAGTAHSAEKFPELTGRVVDSARVIASYDERDLSQELAAFEKQTGIQIVVATVPPLEGRALSDYGIGLARYWKIGHAGKDDGVLVLLAPKEKLARIEVGYGLEGVLPDVTANDILRDAILPPLQADNVRQSAADGIHALFNVLGGKEAMPRIAPTPTEKSGSAPAANYAPARVIHLDPHKNTSVNPTRTELPAAQTQKTEIRAIPDADSGGDGWSVAFYLFLFIAFLFLLRHNPQLAFLLLDIVLRSRGGGSRFRIGRSGDDDNFRPGGGKFGGGGAG